MTDYDIYYQEHIACPICGSDSIETSLVGYYSVPHKDKNTAKCLCGWKGIVDDLVPIKEI